MSILDFFRRKRASARQDYNPLLSEGLDIDTFTATASSEYCHAQIPNTIVFQLSGEINASVAEKLAYFLVEHDNNINDTNVVKPVRIVINSHGGSVYPLLSIIDTMKYVSCPVETECIGMAAGVASVLLAMGESGHRYAHKNSRIMILKPIYINDRGCDYETIQKEFQFVYNEILSMLSVKCNKSVEEIDTAMTNGDFWMTADEALRFGLIDEIIE